MKSKKYFIFCHSLVEERDGQKVCVPSHTFYFSYPSSDIIKSRKDLIKLVSYLGFHYFDVIDFVDGLPHKVYRTTSTNLPL